MTLDTREDLMAALAASNLPTDDRRDILGLILCDQLGLARVALAGCTKALEAGAHERTEYGTTSCPVEHVRAEVDDDDECSACGASVPSGLR